MKRENLNGMCMAKRNSFARFLVLLAGLIFGLGICLAGCGSSHVHTLTYMAATEATCTTDGNVECWFCADCGKYFADEDATTELANNSWLIPATGHAYFVTSWQWNGTTSATVTLVCANDSAHTTQAEATITSTTTATCTQSGTRTYTATVTVDGQTFTDTQDVEEDALGHSYVATWVWESDYSCAKATIVCENDATDTQTLDATVESVTTAEASYTSTGLITHTATVTFNEQTFTDVQKEVVAKWANNYTTTTTAVYDEAAGKYIASTTVTDESGNEYERFTLTPYGDTDADVEFTISGTIDNGQIYVNDEDEAYTVVINLSTASISCSYDSPIYVASGDSVEISAKKKTENYIYDNRSQIESEDSDTSTLGKGAIYAKCDLKLKGSGTLYVYGNYNNGVHTTKDLEIKNLTLVVEAFNNALKGNDSVTIESGTITVISTAGDGIKTTNSDISSKGNQRGTVTISGGTVTIYACFDGIDSSYDVEICESTDSSPVVSIYTWTYAYEQCEYIDTSLNSYATSSSSSASVNATGFMNNTGFGNQPGNQKENGKETDPNSEGNDYKTTYSCKGIKANNQISISGGTVTVYAVDDAIHANSDEELENGASALGNVEISDGTVTLTSLDDAIHADNTVSISGGTLLVEESYEGIEGNLIEISEGTVTVYASDDGINACDGSSSSCVTISGGSVSVYVPCDDCDGIDSNGDYVQTGGTVVACSATSDSSGNAAALDADDSIKVSGNSTLVLAGTFKGSVSTSLKSHTFSTSKSFASGSYSILCGTETILTFTLDTNDSTTSTFSALKIYSYLLSSGSSYTLYCGSSSLESWTQ